MVTKMKKNLPLILMSIIFIVMLVVIICVFGTGTGIDTELTKATESTKATELIAEFSYPNATNVTAEELLTNTYDLLGFGDKNRGYTAVDGLQANSALLFASVDGINNRKLEWVDFGNILPAMTGGNNNPWSADGCLKIKVSTLDFKDISLTAALLGTNNAPRDFKVQYSMDDVTYYDTELTSSFKTNKVVTNLFLDAALPVEAAGNDTLWIKIKINSGFIIQGTEIVDGNTGGSLGISYICVEGNNIT